MRRFLLFALLVFCVRPCQAAGLKMEVMYSEIANLTYQLDLVAGVNPRADPQNFQRLWKQEFLKTDLDQAMVKQWRQVRGRYEATVSLPSQPRPLEPEWSYVSLAERIQIAGLCSRTPTEYRDKLYLLVLPTDGLLFQQVVDHFWPAFDAWWKQEAALKGKRFVEEIGKEMNKPALLEQVERFRHFYGSILPDGYVANFSMIYRPNFVQAPTSGQQLGGQSVVEFLPNEEPKARLDVVIHEFCHFLYGTRASDAGLKVQEAFVATGDTFAKPSYNLLNEAMATVLGNGIVGRMLSDPARWEAVLKRPRSLYNNESIDRAAKSMLPVMDKWLAAGKTITDPEFAATYLATLKQEFGESLGSPSMFLNEAFIYVDQHIGQAFAKKLRNDLRIASAYIGVSDTIGDKELRDFKERRFLSAIFVIPAGQVEKLETNGVIDASGSAAIRAGLAKDKSVLYAVSRNAMAQTYVIVADDVEESTKRLAELGAAKKLFQGVYSATSADTSG